MTTNLATPGTKTLDPDACCLQPLLPAGNLIQLPAGRFLTILVSLPLARALSCTMWSTCRFQYVYDLIRRVKGLPRDDLSLLTENLISVLVTLEWSPKLKDGTGAQSRPKRLISIMSALLGKTLTFTSEELCPTLRKDRQTYRKTSNAVSNSPNADINWFFPSLAVLSCWMLMPRGSWPCSSTTRLSPKAICSACVSLSFLRSSSLTLNIRRKPWIHVKATCNCGLNILDSSLLLLSRVRGTRNFAWSIPS